MERDISLRECTNFVWYRVATCSEDTLNMFHFCSSPNLLLFQFEPEELSVFIARSDYDFRICCLEFWGI